MPNSIRARALGKEKTRVTRVPPPGPVGSHFPGLDSFKGRGWMKPPLSFN